MPPGPSAGKARRKVPHHAWGCAPHAPRPRGTPPWESHARPPSRTGSQRSGAAGLSRAKAPAAPPTRHPRKTRGRALRKPGLAEMAAFAFVKPAPPGPPRADRHPSGCKPGLHPGRAGSGEKKGTTQHENSSHRKQGRDDRAAVGRKGRNDRRRGVRRRPAREGHQDQGQLRGRVQPRGGGEPVPGRQGELEGDPGPGRGRRVTDPGNRGALDTFAARRPDGQRRAPRC